MHKPLAMFLACVLVLALPPSQGLAGAWPQERGGAFISIDSRLSRPQNALRDGTVSRYNTIYVEYGLTDRLTLGLDLGRSVSGAEKSVIFLRHPLPSPRPEWKLAAELGVGRIEGAQVLRPGFSLGRGLDFGGGRYGWISLDAIAEIDLELGVTDYKVDATFGVNLPDMRKLMVQLQTGAPHDARPFLRVAPSIVLPAGKSRYVELGLTVGLKGDDQLGVKFGFWQKF